MIPERIREIIAYKHISDRKFCQEVGIANGYLDKVKDVGGEKMLKILNRYPDISPEWLLTGQGEMLKDTAILQATPDKQGIPLLSAQAAAGFGTANFAIAEHDVKAYYIVPKFNGRKIDFMIEVYGSSMYPKYNSGDVIACTVLRESRFIQWNKVHVIATEEQGILVKRLKQSPTDDCILAVSDNKSYDPFDIPVKEITGIALVVGVIRLE